MAVSHEIVFFSVFIYDTVLSAVGTRVSEENSVSIRRVAVIRVRIGSGNVGRWEAVTFLRRS